ncbi:MAG: glycosyltransferase family 2 protein [Candidatus Hodarchaeota archaeon]
MRRPLVSIAMTTYNGAKFLREQLDSIYRQTYPNLEVVVTDDCSTDNTIDILEEYKKKLGLCYYVNKTKIGFVKNFERAVSLCKGEYIALADQDDVWFPNKIAVLVNNINSASLICSNAYLIDQNGKIFGMQKWIDHTVPTKKEKQFKMLLYKNFVAGFTSLFTREILLKALPIPDGIWGHDWWFGIVASKMGGIKCLNISLVNHRRHFENISMLNPNPHPYWKRFQYFLNRNSRYKMMKLRNYQYENLRAANTSPIFNKSEQRYLKKAIDYYKDYYQLKSYVRKHNTALKSENPSLNPLFRLIKLFLSFSGFMFLCFLGFLDPQPSK